MEFALHSAVKAWALCALTGSLDDTPDTCLHGALLLMQAIQSY